MKIAYKLQWYGLAAICCALAAAIAWPIDAPSSSFLLAVMVSSLFGGLGPGLLSVTLSALAFDLFFLHRTSPKTSEPEAFLRFAVFVAATLLVTGLMEIKRRVEESRNSAEAALRAAHADLAHINRVNIMGELTASLSHEIAQPIAAAVTDANTTLRWLARDQPDLREAREAASRVVKDANRAAEIVSRVRALFKKGTSPREFVDVNEVIREMIVLMGNEATRHSISVRTGLVENLPAVFGDRVQLQQVLMNLMINSIDAMKEIDGTRELIINAQPTDNDQVVVSVSDTGVGLPQQQEENQIFNAFFTTKPQGTGMGLRISQSIIESHGGRLWAAANPPRGASFYFTLLTKEEAEA
jgi:C4-dicarboxylate-specific signal transduction histidine kinase